MIFFLIILILIIAIMGIAVYESFTGKNGSSAESKTTPPPQETTYHIENKDVGLHHSANDFINQPKIPEPEESKPKRKPFRPTLGERLEFWIDGAGYDTSNESGIPTNCGTSCSH